MSPLGPMGDPSFVSREVRRHVSELDWEAANKELQHQARLARTGQVSPSRASALPRRLPSARRLVRSWFVIVRRAIGRPIAPVANSREAAARGTAPGADPASPRSVM